MKYLNENTNPLSGLSNDQIKKLINDNDKLEQQEKKIKQEIIDERIIKEREKRFKNRPFLKLRRSPFEIINRSLLLVFLGCFIFSFYTLYKIDLKWFILYLVSSFSCILYTPNRKTLKELIAAWPNILDLIKNRSLWKKD